MPAMSRIALTLGLALGASAAKNSILAPTGAEKLTVGLLGGMLIRSSWRYPLISKKKKKNIITK